MWVYSFHCDVLSSAVDIAVLLLLRKVISRMTFTSIKVVSGYRLPNRNELAPPFLFGRICFVVLVMRKGGENSWSGPWHLGCTSEVSHVHSYQDQFIQPGWAEVFFCVFSLGLCFVSVHLCFLICLCVSILLCFPEQLSHLSYSFWR